MIQVDNLSFRYPKAVSEAIRGLSFSVSSGEVFGFLGPSGAGKSTTQKILMGSLRGYEGSATVGGIEVSKADSTFRESLGVAFEFPCFYQKLTGLENLQLFASLYPGKKDEPMVLLERLGLGEAAHKRVGEYSKGMKMRLNLARAVIHYPPVLFLDEPTSGLDPGNIKVVRELVLERATAGSVVFLTTHDMATADAMCDRVAFLVNGQIAACDTPANLKRRYGRRAVVVEHGASHGIGQEFSLENLAENSDFLASLRKPDLLGIRFLDSSLDRIFLELTGQELS
jgi:fluoroquinolone transport system ATP-binding protein